MSLFAVSSSETEIMEEDGVAYCPMGETRKDTASSSVWDFCARLVENCHKPHAIQK